MFRSFLIPPHKCGNHRLIFASPATPLEYNVLSKAAIQVEVQSFKKSLAVTEADVYNIEMKTRDQRELLEWFQFRCFQITASYCGKIRRQKETTKPEALVLCMIGVRTQWKENAPIVWGRSDESCALEKYKQEKLASAHVLTVTKTGLWISPKYPFLGASPDAAIHDPSECQPFGFAEVKCPYKHRYTTPKDACADPSFCCELVQCDGKEQLKLKRSHIYYSQVQGQMAIGHRTWCDFIVYTTKGMSIERIYFENLFWDGELLPKLTNFYNNCFAPKILHPMRSSRT